MPACHQVAPAFGPTLPQARQNADEFFYSVGSRFTNIQRPAKVIRARSQFGHYALTPSGVYGDTTAWMGIGPDDARLFGNEGVFAGDRYVVRQSIANTLPDALTESREIVRLRKLSPSEYEWFTNVDVALGNLEPADIGNVVTAGLAAGEGKSAATIRADYRASFPRTTAALGRLFTLDTIRAIPDGEGATTYDLAVKLTPEKLKAWMPAYAGYIDKYISSGKYSITLTDRSGARWLEASASNYYMRFRVRSRGGHFAPLEGAVRPMPEALTIRLDMAMKILVFTVGFENLVGEFNIIDTPMERGWAMRFAREPEWRFPPTVRYFLKTPLRRPFAGQGIPIRISIRSQPRGQTLLNRRLSVVVQESAILRFLNRLSGTAVGDFLGPSEREANRFNADAFRALRADASMLLQ